MEEKLSTIILHYGLEHQRNKLAEEYRELQDELYKFTNDEEEDILGEFVDVLVVTLQFMVLAGYSFPNLKEVIKRKIEFKVDRQLDRIEKEVKDE